MVIAEKDATSFTIPGGTEGVLYPPGPDQAFSIAMVYIDGVYPQKGWSVNDKCTETIYVLKGRITVDIDEESFDLKSGDLLGVVPGRKYRVRGKAETIDFITPAWEKEQNHIVDDN